MIQYDSSRVRNVNVPEVNKRKHSLEEPRGLRMEKIGKQQSKLKGREKYVEDTEYGIKRSEN